MRYKHEEAGREPGRECIATLGPASFHLCAALAEAGATGFRLNTSHMTVAEISSALIASRTPNPSLPVYLDLQAAKMRLGRFEARLAIPGEELLLALHPGRHGSIPLEHPEIYRQVRPGETLRVDDDRIRLEVIRADSEKIRAVVVSGGWLRPRKGINVAEHPVRMEDLSPFDSEVCALGAREAHVRFAVSFVQDGSEAGWVRRRTPGRRIAGKVERREATEAISQLGAVFDSLWICRGDLASQLGTVEMAAWVHRFDPRSVSLPVLMAGQVLEHLTEHAEPTRSEVCHLYDLLARGYAGFILSDETAIGCDPVGAVRAMTAIKY